MAPRFVARLPDEDKPRVILMLQGHPSPFWAELGDGLRADGHRVLKVHFGVADAVFWGRRPAIYFRGRFRRWRDFVADLMSREGVTDVLYYADRLPYHKVAAEVANAQNRCAWTVEHGYLRPDWLTFERDGMGAFSRFPRDRVEIEKLAAFMPAPDMKVRFRHGFAEEAFYEVSFGLLQSFGRVFYPFHVSDRAVWPALDYVSWLPELALARRRARHADRLAETLLTARVPFNLVALQLEADYQIRASSPYRRLGDFVNEVLRSFSENAPADRRLVFKVHPLDNGLGRWFARIPAAARTHGVADRVHVIRGGDLGRLLSASRGVVLVNSTVGLHALRMKIPVCAMGTAVFDLPGLSHQAGIDAFWSQPDPVDPKFYSVFERALATIQVKGSFYARDGRAHAISEMRRRMQSPTVPKRPASASLGQSGLIEPPTRSGLSARRE